MKVAVNKRYGGFGLSPKAIELYLKKTGKDCFFYKQTKYAHNNGGVAEFVKISTEQAQAENVLSTYAQTVDCGDSIAKLPDDTFWYDTFHNDRSNKELIETIEELGEELASGQLASIRIIEIPDGTDFEIDEYDGIESIHEVHRSW